MMEHNVGDGLLLGYSCPSTKIQGSNWTSISGKASSVVCVDYFLVISPLIVNELGT